ncbi:MAG: hypothetical protein M0P39_11305 [Rhodocyclaceae bacterium]|nr:hypothetical protein [Rhodocyclaceae bacterium]
MRLLFLALLLANLIFLVWSGGYFVTTDAGHEPQRLAAQMATERLRLVVAERVGQGGGLFCKAVEGLAEVDAEKFGAEIGKLDGVKAETVVREAPAKFVVLIPALLSRESAAAKIAEIRKLEGIVAELRVDEESDGKFAIVFREFPSEQAATDYLQEIGRRGVRSAKLVLRPGSATILRIEVRGVAAAVPRVEALLATLVGIHGEECDVP